MAPTAPHRMRRRQLLGLGVGVGLAALGGCSRPTQPNLERRQTTNAPTDAVPKVLVAYFSRAGENYYYGDRTRLKIGNTQVIAEMIPELIPCDLHKIEAADPYPDDYEETVDRNVSEQNADARPAIANPLASIDSYDVVLLGSGIWNVRAPMIMSTFTDSHDFTGKTVHPFTTYAMSGLGTTERDYTRSCKGATIGEGLAIRGEQAQAARPDVTAWLRRIGLTGRR